MRTSGNSVIIKTGLLEVLRQPKSDFTDLLIRKESMTNQIWFTKYRIIKPLGQGGSADVFLAEHIKLKALRAIKRISKSNLLHEQLLNEAFILKNLKHPSIPVIYDFEEDAHNSYIIEQYIEGQSLKDYRQQNQRLSEDIILHFAVQICDLLQYLYSLKNPILYLDLKPENIIISEKTVKLIDFGASSFKSNLEDRKYSFGSKGFAAPELYSGQKPDERTDVYGIGALLYFMAAGSPYQPDVSGWNKESFKNYSRKLKNITRKCVRHTSTYRYPTILSLKNDLLASSRKKTADVSKKSLTIAVAGTQHRMGATHLALLITSYLNKTGKGCFYIENNESGHISSILKRYQNIKTKNGIYQLYHCNVIPNTKSYLPYPKEDYPFTVLDYGCLNKDNLEEFLKAEIKLVIAGSKDWELNETERILRMLNGYKDITYLFNFLDGSQYAESVKHMGNLNCCRVPYEPNPYQYKKNVLLEDFLKTLVSGG